MADEDVPEMYRGSHRKKRIRKHKPAEPRDPNRSRARNRVRSAVLKGHLPHANSVPCVDCGHVWQEGDCRHEYDHYLGYAEEHHLSVQPVCKQCHTKRDSPYLNKTHCAKGHPFSVENTTYSCGRRKCRICAVVFQTEYRKRLKLGRVQNRLNAEVPA